MTNPTGNLQDDVDALAGYDDVLVAETRDPQTGELSVKPEAADAIGTKLVEGGYEVYIYERTAGKHYKGGTRIKFHPSGDPEVVEL